MKTTIPEKKITTCDVCKRTDDGENRRKYWRQNGGLTIRQDALDYQGCAVADGSVKLDLCDPCLHAVSDLINNYAKNWNPNE